MAEVKVLYDEIGNTLTVWFGNSADEYVCEETGEEVILMKDKEGHVIGFEKLNYVADRSIGFQVGLKTAGATVTAQHEREPDA